jgi:hypothetical protein
MGYTDYCLDKAAPATSTNAMGMVAQKVTRM